MCLYLDHETDRKVYPIPTIAKKNIIVYKIVRPTDKKGTVESQFNYFLYTRGYLYYQKKERHETNIDENGFGKQFISGKWVINEGLHTITSLEKAEALARRSSSLMNNFIVVKMIIPKGALYYMDTISEEAASNQLYFP